MHRRKPIVPGHCQGKRIRPEVAPATDVPEAYARSLSTRLVDEMVKALGMIGISEHPMPRMSAKFDELVNAFRIS